MQVSRPSRHPIPEGLVACSDCHNAHGSVGPKMMVRDNVNDTCYTCHMEKRGPFVRTHQPGRRTARSAITRMERRRRICSRLASRSCASSATSPPATAATSRPSPAPAPARTPWRGAA